MSVPAADYLFRPTSSDPTQNAAGHTATGQSPATQDALRAVPDAAAPDAPESDPTATTAAVADAAQASGRVRHDEKITVYVTADELFEIEHARLVLRRTHGLAVDRGRLVREAVALVLTDLEAHGEDSALVRRLTHT